MKSHTLARLAAAALLPSAMAQLVEFRPSNQDISYRVNVPGQTASRGSGPIYIQVDAPASVQYAAIGQGTGMIGANIFVVYSSSDRNNVTVSPRSGEGHFEPELNEESRVTLLEGSGISNNRMIANFRCDNCLSWSGGSIDLQDNSSPWIWSMREGDPLDSSDPAEPLQYHDARGRFTLDLTRAAGGPPRNPFLDLDPSTINESGTDTSGPNLNLIRTIHAIIMSVVSIILFPVFALSIHVIRYSKTVPRIHAPLQLLTVLITLGGAGLGLYMASEKGWPAHHHPIIGLVVVACLILCQPVLGLIQHRHFRRTREQGIYGLIHRWTGRGVIVLAVINGGLGFRWVGIGNPGAPWAAVYAYIAAAGVMAILYGLIVVMSSMRASRSLHGGKRSPVR